MKKELDLFPSPYGVVSFNLRFQNICMTDMIGFPSPYGVVSFNLDGKSFTVSTEFVSVPLRGSQFQSLRVWYWYR